MKPDVVSRYDHRYFNPSPALPTREEIFSEMQEDGYELISIEPAIDHPVAEHRIPPLLTFKRKAP